MRIVKETSCICDAMFWTDPNENKRYLCIGEKEGGLFEIYDYIPVEEVEDYLSKFDIVKINLVDKDRDVCKKSDIKQYSWSKCNNGCSIQDFMDACNG